LTISFTTLHSQEKCFDEQKGIPNEFKGSLTESDNILFEEQNFNSEKYTVKFSNAGVSYIPEGKLYSMGELVKGTEGWGEISPNREWESEKTFFNDITGKYETYVKHFKFFYGPKEKTTFGGYYTYPYSCTFEYEHYKPITCYSGEVVYEYESIEEVKGYSYNGWIKIRYTAEKAVNDYPPTAPFNVKYNAVTGEISWEAGNDDYTAKEELKYEVWIFDGEWKPAFNDAFNELKADYIIDYSEPDVKIRTVDEYNQVSDWSYASRSCIELTGELKPYIVKPGECIDIFAVTKSLEKVNSVVVKNDKLQMYQALQKTEETTPNFTEISYDIEADFPEETNDYFVVSGRVATGNKGKADSYKFRVNKEFDDGSIEFKFTEDVKFDENGTVIFSNTNYDNIPVDMFEFDSKYWYIMWDNLMYVNNKVTGGSDMLFRIESTTELKPYKYTNIIVPKHVITVNKFKYKESGRPVYEYIPVDKKYLKKPFSLTWNTDADGITSLGLYSGTDLIYEYEALWEDINKHVDNFNSIYMYKQMRQYGKTSYGYVKSNKRADWNKIVLSVMPNRDLRPFTWLGYRVRNNEYVNTQYVDEYNGDPDVRNNYRVLFCDDTMSENAIKRYNDILKTANISMSKDEETIFGDDVTEYTSAFEGLNIKIPDDASTGSYEIELVATDVTGNISEIKLTLIVQKEDVREEDKNEGIDTEDTDDESVPTVADIFFGRFFYRNGKGYLEELKKTTTTEENGFVCAGETIGFSLVAEDTEYIEIDFFGDDSIKTLDSLTEKFLIDIPIENGKDVTGIRDRYVNFPQKIYPQYVDNFEPKVFKWFYVVPYGTVQSLESWSSLKNDTLEKIDTGRLFERITEPYGLIIYPNGDTEKAIHLRFDVFERWDTVLNRDVTEYVINSDTRWEMRIDK